MNSIEEEEINCIFEGDQDVPIFDQDNWSEEYESSAESSKNIPFKVNIGKEEKYMIKKIKEELEDSK